jgi:hypothetical protein
MLDVARAHLHTKNKKKKKGSKRDKDQIFAHFSSAQ